MTAQSPAEEPAAPIVEGITLDRRMRLIAPPEECSPAELIARLPPEERSRQLRTLFKDLSREEIWAKLENNWEFWARPKQQEPPWPWYEWMYLAGRGSGKTRAGAQLTHKKAKEGKHPRMFLIGRTAADVRDVMIGGESGLMACAPPDFRPVWKPSSRKLEWPNGVTALHFSAEEPDSLRGPQAGFAWCDEVAAWRYAEDVISNMEFGLRLAQDPQIFYSTTPRPVPLIKRIVQDFRAQQTLHQMGGPPPNTFVTSGSTFDNISNLPTKYIETVVRRYYGTRLGRQELFAEILDDNPGAVFHQSDIDNFRVKSIPRLSRIVVGVDPASTSEGGAEVGIVVTGYAYIRGVKHGFVIDDRTVQGTPAVWGAAVVRAYEMYSADAVVVEINNGGEMCEHVIRTTPGGEDIKVETVHASRGKITRAEPVGGLYEQGRFHHLGIFAELEDQQTTYTPEDKDSPDRMDAAVWAAYSLFLGELWVPAPVVSPTVITKPSLWRR
jgi:phage terminase large subunit-like protein